MKILYAIQGTGNGHISRAMEIVPHLQKRAEVDVMVSASQWDLKLPFPIKFHYNGLGFVFGKNGGVDILKTYQKLNSFQVLREIKMLPVENYDLIISDFEPISCWASKFKKKVCIGLSNQAATLHPLAPKPESADTFGKMVLQHYAPCTHQYGFHFKQFDESVYTPIIRKEIREHKITDNGHITVYLPSYDDKKIVQKLRSYKNMEFQIFSKHTNNSYKLNNLRVHPLNNIDFINSLASSSGVICNAGFGTTAEALFLQKKLLVIPMKTQYEQACNAEVLKTMGVTVLKNLKKKHEDKISDWLNSGEPAPVNYPDRTEELLDKIILNHAGEQINNASDESDLNIVKRIFYSRKFKFSL